MFTRIKPLLERQSHSHYHQYHSAFFLSTAEHMPLQDISEVACRSGRWSFQSAFIHPQSLFRFHSILQ